LGGFLTAEWLLGGQPVVVAVFLDCHFVGLPEMLDQHPEPPSAFSTLDGGLGSLDHAKRAVAGHLDANQLVFGGERRAFATPPVMGGAQSVGDHDP
jgi:hypothetical protein